MEVAGLAVGVAPLLSLCLELLDKARDFKEYKSSTSQLNARFELAKFRLRQWAQAVGIEGSNSADQRHPLLDRSEIRRVVGTVLNCLLTNFGGSIEDAEIVVAQQHRQAETAPPGWKTVRRKNTDTSKLVRSTRSGKNALLWATGHKVVFTEQVDVFEILVDRLHEIVPLDNTEDALKSATDAIKRIELGQNGMLELVKNMRQDALLRRMRLVDEWLDAPSFDQGFEKHVETRLHDTCNWLFQNDTYRSWENEDALLEGAKLFWLSAPPGHGKSVLAAALTQRMMKTNPSPTAYFFSSPHVQFGSSPDIVIRSWISQLVRADPSISDLVYSQLATSTVPKIKASELWRLFRDVLLAVDGCTLVLDGYDEFARAGDSRKDFLRCLKAQLVNTKTRVFLSSRPEDEIEAELSSEGLPGLSLSRHRVTPEDVKTDVAIYSKHTIMEQLPGKDETFQKELSDLMVSKCDGMFLWIRLQRPELRDGKSKKRLREVVNRLPDGLTQSYNRTWDDIMTKSDYDRQRAIEILRWACFAMRPLTVMELTEALAHGHDSTDACEDDMPDDVSNDYVNGEIKGLCGSLIEVRQCFDDEGMDIPADRTIHLVHVSAKEFLASRLPLPHLMTLQTDGASGRATHHMQLAEVCLRYMNCDVTWKKSVTDNVEDDQSVLQEGLMKYATTAWYTHWQEAKMTTGEYKSLTSKLFACDSPHFGKWTRNDVFYEDEWIPRKTETGLNARLYLAVLFELDHVVDDLHTNGNLDFAPTTFSHGTALAVAARREDATFEKLISWGADVNPRCGRDGSALGAAVRACSHRNIRVLLDQGANVRSRDWKGLSILAIACLRDDLDTMRLLLDYDADPSDRDNVKFSPLCWCAAGANLDGARLLLDRGADVMLADHEGWSVLHYACCFNNVKVFDLLLDHGADMSLCTKSGHTSLTVAIDAGHPAVVRALLQRVPDPLSLIGTHKDELWHPVYRAAVGGDVEIIKSLMEHGVDLSMSTKDGLTVLHFACEHVDRAETVEFLLDTGLDVTPQDKRGRTPLHLATQQGLPNVTKALLARGANPHAEAYISEDCVQSIHLAAQSGNIETLQLLLSHGVDVNVATGVEGDTPLHVACREPDLDRIRFLSDQGADFWARDSGGLTPLDRACQNGNLAAVEFLLKNYDVVSLKTDDGWTLMHSACQGGSAEIVNLLLQKGADPLQETNHGTPPLVPACYAGTKESVVLLIRNGADPSQLERETGMAPLHFACCGGQPDTFGKVKILLENGADVSQQTKAGLTALHYACGNAGASDEVVDLIKFLIDQGADLTQLSHGGETPLHYAARSGSLDAVKFLLESGVPLPGQTGPIIDPLCLMHFAAESGNPEMVQFFLEKNVPINRKTRLGMTPLHTAIFEGHVEVVEKLIDAGADVVFPVWLGDTVMERIEYTFPKHEKILQWKSKVQFEVPLCDRIIWLRQQISDVAQDALTVNQYPDEEYRYIFLQLGVCFWRLGAREDFVFTSQQRCLRKTVRGQAIRHYECSACERDPIIGEAWCCFTCPPRDATDSTQFCGSCKARLHDTEKVELRDCAKHELVPIPSYGGEDVKDEDGRVKDPEVRKWLETVVGRYKVDGPMPTPKPIVQTTQ